MNQKTTSILVIVDLVIILLFSAVGRLSHHMVLDPSLLLNTTLPFAAAWLIVGALTGIFKPASVESTGRAFKSTLLTLVIAGPLGVLLRSLLIGRMPFYTFWFIGPLNLAMFMLPWRLVYAYFKRKTG